MASMAATISGIAPSLRLAYARACARPRLMRISKLYFPFFFFRVFLKGYFFLGASGAVDNFHRDLSDAAAGMASTGR